MCWCRDPYRRYTGGTLRTSTYRSSIARRWNVGAAAARVRGINPLTPKSFPTCAHRASTCGRNQLQRGYPPRPRRSCAPQHPAPAGIGRRDIRLAVARCRGDPTRGTVSARNRNIRNHLSHYAKAYFNGIWSNTCFRRHLLYAPGHGTRQKHSPERDR